MINPEDRNLQSCWQVYSYENVYRICSTQRPQQIDPRAVGYAHLTWLVWKGSSAKLAVYDFAFVHPGILNILNKQDLSLSH